MFKTLVFADPHCGPALVSCKKRRPSEGLSRVAAVCGIAGAVGADLIICLGDVCDGGPSYSAGGYVWMAGRIMRETGADVIALPGNHDAVQMDNDTFYSCLGTPPFPFSIRAGSRIFVFLDGCFTDDGKKYGPGADWRNSYVGGGQTARLRLLFEKTTDEDRFVIFTHQPIDPECESRHVLRNSGEIRDVISVAGRGRVETCVAGHYHPGRISDCGGISYVTLPALCEGDANDVCNRILLLES